MVAKAKNSLKEPQKHQRRRGYDLTTVILAIFSNMPYASKFVLYSNSKCGIGMQVDSRFVQPL